DVAGTRRCCEQVISCDPSSADARHNMSMTIQHQIKNGGARRCYEQAIVESSNLPADCDLEMNINDDDTSGRRARSGAKQDATVEGISGISSRDSQSGGCMFSTVVTSSAFHPLATVCCSSVEVDCLLSEPLFDGTPRYGVVCSSVDSGCSASLEHNPGGTP